MLLVAPEPGGLVVADDEVGEAVVVQIGAVLDRLAACEPAPPDDGDVGVGGGEHAVDGAEEDVAADAQVVEAVVVDVADG